MTYKQHTNDHDFFTKEHAERFLRNHSTGTDNHGRRRLGYIVDTYSNPTVLDVACGTCVNWETWKELGINCRYTGFDLTQQFLDIASEKYKDDNIQLDQGYIQEIGQKYDGGSFDVVVMRHILEHIYQGDYKDIIRQGLEIASKELVIVFFLPPHNGNDDIIEERSSNVEGRPEVTHFWNTYSWTKLVSFFTELGVQFETETVYTPSAAHADFIVRLKK